MNLLELKFFAEKTVTVNPVYIEYMEPWDQNRTVIHFTSGEKLTVQENHTTLVHLLKAHKTGNK